MIETKSPNSLPRRAAASSFLLVASACLRAPAASRWAAFSSSRTRSNSSRADSASPLRFVLLGLGLLESTSDVGRGLLGLIATGGPRRVHVPLRLRLQALEFAAPFRDLLFNLRASRGGITGGFDRGSPRGLKFRGQTFDQCFGLLPAFAGGLEFTLEPFALPLLAFDVDLELLAALPLLVARLLDLGDLAAGIGARLPAPFQPQLEFVDLAGAVVEQGPGLLGPGLGHRQLGAQPGHLVLDRAQPAQLVPDRAQLFADAAGFRPFAIQVGVERGDPGFPLAVFSRRARRRGIARRRRGARGLIRTDRGRTRGIADGADERQIAVRTLDQPRPHPDLTRRAIGPQQHQAAVRAVAGAARAHAQERAQETEPMVRMDLIHREGADQVRDLAARERLDHRAQPVPTAVDVAAEDGVRRSIEQLAQSDGRRRQLLGSGPTGLGLFGGWLGHGLRTRGSTNTTRRREASRSDHS